MSIGQSWEITVLGSMTFQGHQRSINKNAQEAVSTSLFQQKCNIWENINDFRDESCSKNVKMWYWGQ